MTANAAKNDQPLNSSRVPTEGQEGKIMGPNSHRKLKRTSLAERMEKNDQLHTKQVIPSHKLQRVSSDVPIDEINEGSRISEIEKPQATRRSTMLNHPTGGVMINNSAQKPPLSNQSSKGHRLMASAQSVSAFGASSRGQENNSHQLYQNSQTMSKQNSYSKASESAQTFNSNIEDRSTVNLRNNEENKSDLASLSLSKNASSSQRKAAYKEADVTSTESQGLTGIFYKLTGNLFKQSSQSNAAKDEELAQTERQNVAALGTKELSPSDIMKNGKGSPDNQASILGSGKQMRRVSVKVLANYATPDGEEVIPVNCQYCPEQVGSDVLDTHERQCAESLSVKEMQKMKEIPQTKIISTELNQIKRHDSSEGEEDDCASVERTPSRNKLVHQVQNSFSEKKNQESPFSLQHQKYSMNHAISSTTLAVPKSREVKKHVSGGAVDREHNNGSGLMQLIGNDSRGRLFQREQPGTTTNANRPKLQYGATTVTSIASSQGESNTLQSYRVQVPQALSKKESDVSALLKNKESEDSKQVKEELANDAEKKKPRQKSPSGVKSMFGFFDMNFFGGGKAQPEETKQSAVQAQPQEISNEKPKQESHGAPINHSSRRSMGEPHSMKNAENDYLLASDSVRNIQKVADSQKSYQVGGSRNLKALIGGNNLRDRSNQKQRYSASRGSKMSNQYLSPPKHASRGLGQNAMAGKSMEGSANNQSPFKHMLKAEPLQISPRFESSKQPDSSSPALFSQTDDQKKMTAHNLMKPAKRSGPTSGESMSTNDQSNPSPNMPAAASTSNNMQVRTQILQGMTPQEALEKYEGELTPFEMTEVNSYDFIYTVGSVRVNSLRQVSTKEGFYHAHLGEQLGYRYLIDKIIDAGAFGQVVRCIDMKDSGRPLAIKISKNKKQETDNARVEAKLLKRILGRDPDKYGIVKMFDSFYFRKHFIIVFELLDINLYRYIKQPGFRGMNKDLLRQIATQMLHGLQHLSKIKIIHCDLKPENVLFTDATRTGVKIIDFGSACTEFKSGFVYVQSRFYRSPEVVLGLPYDQAVDMWSFGCILAELVTGRPLFPAIDENELLELFRVRIGPPPEEMTRRCKKRKLFFNYKGEMIRSKKSRVPPGAPDRSDTIRRALYSEGDDDFCDFIEKCLKLDPKERLTPELALKHNWIKRSKLQSVFKENQMTNKFLLKDLEDVIRPLPSTKRERAVVQRQLQRQDRGDNQQRSTRNTAAAAAASSSSQHERDDLRNNNRNGGHSSGNALAAVASASELGGAAMQTKTTTTTTTTGQPQSTTQYSMGANQSFSTLPPKN